MPFDQVERTIAPVAESVKKVIEATGRKYDDVLAYAFPDVAPPIIPLGTRLLVQLRTPGSFKILPNGKKFYFADESQAWMQAEVQTSLVRAMGPAAFRNRATMQPWPEGAWCVPGEFIRMPKYGGDRIAVPIGDEQNREAIFMMLEDRDVVGLVRGDPLSIKAVV